jgi:glycosyltransferase involved in cell wall biosynthesis
VVPYERYLNSGWTVLALTAGIPVIAPAAGTAAEVVRSGALRTFDSADPRDLARALADAPSLATAEARVEARRSVADLHAADISAAFADLVRTVTVDR